jgi:CspA family cold shock protein
MSKSRDHREARRPRRGGDRFASVSNDASEPTYFQRRTQVDAVPQAEASASGAIAYDTDERESSATVKWYNLEKGFGFVSPDEGDKDIFVHASALNRSGIPSLTEGQRITVRYGQGRKGLEARTVRVD